MSTAKRSPGIEVRHSKKCATNAAAKCDCTPTYRAHLWDERNARRVRKTFKTLSAAKQWRRDADTAIARGEITDPTRTPRVGEALDDLLARMEDGTALTRSGSNYKPGTIRTYRYAIRDVWKPQLGHLRLSEVRRADVQRIADRLRADGLSASAIRNTLDPLRVVYRRAMRDEIVQRDPTKLLDLPAVRPAVKDVSAADDRDALLAPLPPLERALWATALCAGLRRGELRGLRWDDVDTEAGVIHVRRSWDDVEGEQEPKTAAGVRDVPLVTMLRRELAAWRLRSGRGDGLVFGQTETEPFSTSSVDRRAKDAWGKGGGITLHAARHAYASSIIAAGISPKAAQTYLGHSSITTTYDTYGHLFPSTLLADTERFDAYLVSRGTMAGQ